jgi:1,4-dihydroxy-2-naphthoyl-CoA hydrolase
MTPEQLAALPPSPFDALLGLEHVELGGERVVVRLDVDPARHGQVHGIVHGGVYCTLAETAASIGAALARGGEGAVGAVGLSNSTDFLRATRSGVLTATATPVHVGRSVQLWQVVIEDDGGRAVARSTVRLFNVDGERMSAG